MLSDDKDSLGKLIDDMEQVAAPRAYACRYFGKQVDDDCDGCPARGKRCYEFVFNDLARRMRALMPHDMDGREIKAGDTVRVVGSAAKAIKVSGIRAVPFGDEVGSSGYVDTPVEHPHVWSVVEPDSWERLEQDAAKRVCEYAGAQKSIADADRYSCINCPYDEPGPHTDKGCHERMRLDLVRRAKALAKAGEGE